MPTTQVQPYLFFDGRCDEALEFYRRALGAEVTMLMRFKESPDREMVTPGTEDKVMHCSFQVGDAMVMASDGRCEGRPAFQGFALSIAVPTEAEAERRFAALADGGQVQMPLGKTFFSPRFGMVADRFGVGWMVIVTPPAATAKTAALAAQFEAKARDAMATLKGLSDADWKKVTEAEQWPVGVTAHHAAGALEVVPLVLKAMAAGQSLEPFQLGKIDEFNAAHAREHASCTKDETVALFQKGVTAAAAAIRGLSDDQLARTGSLAPGMPPMTVEQVVMLGLVNHVDEHFGSIRRAIGR